MKHITIDGETKLLKDWFSHFGRVPKTYYLRLKQGWTVERALKEPAWDDHQSKPRDGVLPRRDSKKGKLFRRPGVYAIKNRQTGQCYIGQTQDLSRRLYVWRRDFRRYERVLSPYFPELCQDIKKYGPQEFEFYVLKFMPGSTREEREVVESQVISELRKRNLDPYNCYANGRKVKSCRLQSSPKTQLA